METDKNRLLPLLSHLPI